MEQKKLQPRQIKWLVLLEIPTDATLAEVFHREAKWITPTGIKQGCTVIQEIAEC
jgi:hypothetical protein